MKVIELVEELPSTLTRGELTQDQALAIHKRFGQQITINFPTVLTNNSYELNPNGYVGQLPISPDLLIRIEPKVPVTNIFGMLEYAYKLKSFKLFEGTVAVATIDDLFERLAGVLARRTLDRVRRGLYRSYILEEENLPFVRGRISVMPSIRGALRGSTKLWCEYEEHTADIQDNRILAWTLYCLRKLPFKRQTIQQKVRQAYLALAGTITITPVEAQECINRLYHRLNDDYDPMHALCRLFLEHLGPGLEVGGHKSLPYTVNMPMLFERYVAQWLRANAPPELQVIPHCRVVVKANVQLIFDMDIVIRHKQTGEVLAILDTKYKRTAEPDAADISQVAAYALRTRAPKAILVYPSAQTQPFEANIRDISIQSLVFDISKDTLGGEAFLNNLMNAIT